MFQLIAINFSPWANFFSFLMIDSRTHNLPVSPKKCVGWVITIFLPFFLIFSLLTFFNSSILPFFPPSFLLFFLSSFLQFFLSSFLPFHFSYDRLTNTQPSIFTKNVLGWLGIILILPFFLISFPPSCLPFFHSSILPFFPPSFLLFFLSSILPFFNSSFLPFHVWQW